MRLTNRPEPVPKGKRGGRWRRPQLNRRQRDVHLACSASCRSLARRPSTARPSAPPARARADARRRRGRHCERAPPLGAGQAYRLVIRQFHAPKPSRNSARRSSSPGCRHAGHPGGPLAGPADNFGPFLSARLRNTSLSGGVAWTLAAPPIWPKSTCSNRLGKGTRMQCIAVVGAMNAVGQQK